MNPESRSQQQNFTEELPAEETKHIESQKAALRFSVEVGRQIQALYPQMAQEYLAGASLSALAKKYTIQRVFGLTSEDLAESAIRLALNGFKAKPGVTGMESYQGLIEDPKILKAAGKQHHIDQGRKVGLLTKDQKLGIFAMSQEEKIEAGRKSGKARYESRTGIHALSIEEKKRNSKLALMAKGVKPFSDTEKTLMFRLSEQPEFQKGQRLNSQKIAEMLNKELYRGRKIRTPDQITKFLYRNKQ